MPQSDLWKQLNTGRNVWRMKWNNFKSKRFRYCTIDSTLTPCFKLLFWCSFSKKILATSQCHFINPFTFTEAWHWQNHFNLSVLTTESKNVLKGQDWQTCNQKLYCLLWLLHQSKQPAHYNWSDITHPKYNTKRP